MLDAAKIAGCRAIIQTDLAPYPSNTTQGDVFFIDRAPHHRIFPLCSAVVYHGGGGTAHSATRCGRPSVVAGFSNEHMSYGQILYRLGAGSRPIRFRKANAARLARRIRYVLDSPQVRKRALELGTQMQGEDGVRCAVDHIDKLDLT